MLDVRGDMDGDCGCPGQAGRRRSTSLTSVWTQILGAGCGEPPNLKLPGQPLVLSWNEAAKIALVLIGETAVIGCATENWTGSITEDASRIATRALWSSSACWVAESLLSA
jgi:hypothetical protein